MPSSSTSARPPLAVRLERLGLAAGAVQGQQQLPAQALAQRLAGDERLELAGDLRMAAEREVRVDAVLERRDPQLLQPRDLGLEGRLVGQVGERRPAPQRERLVQQRRRGGRVGGRAALGRESLEAEEVELVVVDPQLRSRERG